MTDRRARSPRSRERLRDVDLVYLDPSPRPPQVEAFLADAQGRIDAFFEMWRDAPTLGFFPSDYPLVYESLRSVRATGGEGLRLCEWGSGFGVVTGLAATLGFRACGIEIDSRLTSASRLFLGEHGLSAEILEGSFIPESYSSRDSHSDTETRTILWGAGANDEVDVEVDDFDVIFAFPWPGEEAMFQDIFARYAAVGALLLTYSAMDGIRMQRKIRG